MPSKTPWKLKRLWTNCRAHPGSIILSIINTPRNTWCFSTRCCPKHRWNVVFLARSTFLETVYLFRLDAVQKTIKAEKNVNELSGSPGNSPGKRSFLALSSLLETLDTFGLDVIQKTKKFEKNQLRMWKNCLARLVNFKNKIINTSRNTLCFRNWYGPKD